MRFRERFDHRFAQRRMSDFIDGGLSGRQRRRIERHADACPECGPLRRALVRLVGELRKLGSPVASDRSIAPLVIERVRGCRDLARRRRRLRS